MKKECNSIAMKKFYISILLLVTFVTSSCTQDVLMEHDGILMSNNPMFTASFESADSRTYIEENNNNLYLRWTSNDQLSIFMGTTLNQHYRFTGNTGDNSGGFEQASSPGFVTGNTLDNPCHYAYYPYNSQIKIKEDGVMTVILPTEQDYAKNSFGVGANSMIAVTKDLNDMQLSFKNVGGYFKFKFYGDDITLKSISLKGNQDEKIAGTATLTASHNALPSIKMNSNATEIITLNCGDGIKIGQTKEEATEIWLVIPPIKFEQGFTLTLMDIDGNEFVKSTTKAFEIKRNTIKPISAIKVEIEKIPTYHVAKAGTLSDLIPDEEKTSITEMKVTGNLNGKDITTINRMAGNSWISYYTGFKVGSLRKIDLSEANLIEDMTYYHSSNAGYDGKIKSGEIGKDMFSRCDSLETIILPNNTIIIRNAFFQSPSLTSIILPDGVKTIGEKAFYTSNIKTIELPESLESIEDDAFMWCKQLVSITIPSNVTSIGKGAFYQCNLNSVDIYGICSIGDNAFTMSGIETLNIRNGLKNIGKSAFSNCQFTSLVIPGNDLEIIGEYAFNSCNKLDSFSINSVKSIGDYAFSGHKISILTIPEQVESIGKSSFSGYMKEVHCKAIIPPLISENSFGHSADYATMILYVPNGSLELYESAEGWKLFGTKKEE